jgi:hypothetical protein
MLNAKFLFAVILTIAALAFGGLAQTGAVPIKMQNFRIAAATDYVNVMDDAMPSMPQFSGPAKKPGFVRGYVKDVLGQPVAGAKLGLKSARIYDAYLAASAETNAEGFYEIKIPTGGARFDYAGFTFQYGRGPAAVGLHPADGNLSESYAAATGGVENFVMLPYGVADAEGVGKNPKYRGNYYGGTLMLRYFIAPPGQNPDDFGKMLAPGAEIVVFLNPVSTLSDGNRAAYGFEIRKKIEESSLGEFFICNVPVGRYEMTVVEPNGKPLRLKQKNPTDSVFGIQPQETTGTAQLLFNPLSADAKTAAAAHGNWTDLEIIVERP